MAEETSHIDEDAIRLRVADIMVEYGISVSEFTDILGFKGDAFHSMDESVLYFLVGARQALDRSL